jgi:hypothetical protein
MLDIRLFSNELLDREKNNHGSSKYIFMHSVILQEEDLATSKQKRGGGIIVE